ncbi:unnamed protein product [Parnassius mnemosyne]|uniref:RRM domain-containing protein n=1 Tax=Parnassius mnemosyne TaxID=213953 RepID=A0AAV1LVI5_9NEOP
MKSKSVELLKKGQSVENNKTFDFVNLYKSAAETNVKLLENDDQLGQKLKVKKIKSDCENFSHKSKKKIKSKSDISQNITNDPSEHVRKSSFNEISLITSTPNNGENKKKPGEIRPIIKNSDDSMNIPDVSNSKPKKRNKTVSFVLDDNEETAVKKIKSDNSVDNNNTVQSKNKNKKNKLKKINKRNLGETENKDEACHPKLDKTSDEIIQFSEKHSKISESGETHADLELSKFLVKKKANKKFKKHAKEKESENSEDENKIAVAQDDGQKEQEHVRKKNKKKKHSLKATQVTDPTAGEPVTKSRKKDVKPEIIAEDLENLNIGDNTHTLTNLLDEMMVVDKKKKKNTGKQKKGKHAKLENTSNNDNSFENSVEIKEKEKWRKRKWNKDKKGVLNVDQVLCSVIVENLPLNVMLSYKKLLTEHFSKCGVVKKVGIVEVYPTEDPKPVFTTTVFFDSEDAVSKALEDDNTSFEGNFIRVKRPLPPTKTTLVVRSYGELSEQALSSVFSGAGRIRNIRHLVKGKKSMATAFIEFDGPQAVERAIKMAEEAKIGGKKIHVSKFQLRKVNRDKKIKHSMKNDNTKNSDDSSD